MATPTQDPRRATSGTSLTGKPAVSPDAGSLKEMGINAVTTTIPDVVPAFRTGLAALRILSQMVDNDGTINATLLAIKVPVLGADFYLDPYSSDQLHQDTAEFVAYNLFQNMSLSFLEFAELALTKQEFGFSVFEKVFIEGTWTPKRTMANSKQYYMLQKLAFRPQSTIQKFNYDQNGGPESVTHQLVDPTGTGGGGNNTVDIPIDKLLVFTHRKRGGDLQGKSILRTAYKHWYYKENLYKVDAIQKERHGIGIPHVELPPGMEKVKDEVARAEQMAANLRTNEFARIVTPTGWIVRFMELQGNPVNVLESASHHDLLIARNVLAQFIVDANARATAGTGVDLLMKSLRQEANLFCEVINNHLIPQLVSWNFPTTNYPQLKVRSIGETRDFQAWTSGWANLAGGKLVTPTVELERWLLEQSDAPTSHLDDPAFKQAFEVGTTPSAGTVPTSNTEGGQVQNNQQSDARATPNGQPQTGNVPAPNNAP